MISIFSRRSLLNRRVSLQCNNCRDCRSICSMNAIPQEPHNTDYADCTMCRRMRAACPKRGISFGFGALADKQWQPDRDNTHHRRPLQSAACAAYCPRSCVGHNPLHLTPSYHIPQVVEARAWVACGVCQHIVPSLPSYVQVKETAKQASGIAQIGGIIKLLHPAWPGLQLSRDRYRRMCGERAGAAVTHAGRRNDQPEQRSSVRRALPEDEFVRTCIACARNAWRVCPTGGLRPASLEAGLADRHAPNCSRAGRMFAQPELPNPVRQGMPGWRNSAHQAGGSQSGRRRVDRPCASHGIKMSSACVCGAAW